MDAHVKMDAHDSLCAPGGAERQWAARGENSRNGRTYTWQDPKVENN